MTEALVAPARRDDGDVDGLPGWCIVLDALFNCSLGPEVSGGEDLTCCIKCTA